jgi:predicted dinucleotide-binding enzyme
MRIGIIGAGKVGGSLGKLWVRAGHKVFFSSRHPNRLKALTEEAGPGAYCGTVADAALFGDVILLSPNFWSVDDALEATGPLKGKTVIDATNPLGVESERSDGTFWGLGSNGTKKAVKE